MIPYFNQDTMLVATLIALVVCTRSAGEYASKHRRVVSLEICSPVGLLPSILYLLLCFTLSPMIPYFNQDTMLVATLIALVVCTRSAGEYASKHRRAAQWFWVPFTGILFVLQIFADCSTNNVGISAVWSAYVGFISLGWWRIIATNYRRAATEGPRVEVSTNLSLVTFTTVLSLVLWIAICAYYTVVEEAITTVAHVVAFGVGAVALLVFEVLHGVPSSKDGRQGARCNWAIGSRNEREYEQLQED